MGLHALAPGSRQSLRWAPRSEAGNVRRSVGVQHREETPMGPLYAVLATRALEASKAAQAPGTAAFSASPRAPAGRACPGPRPPAAALRRAHPLGRVGRHPDTARGRAADRPDPPLGDRRRRRPRRAVRTAAPRVRGPHGLRPLAVVHRGLHPRPRPAAVRQHAHRGVGDRPADHGAARGGPPDHPPVGQRRPGGRRRVLRVGRDRRDRQAGPASSTSGAATGPSCSSAPTSTTRTSCRGGSRARTWSRSARTRTGGSTSPISRPSSAGTSTGR